MDSKSALVTVIERLSRRSLSRNEIFFSVDACGNEAMPAFRATAVLACLGEIQFPGSLCSSQEDAEQSAAVAAMEVFAHAGQLAAMHLPSAAVRPPMAAKRGAAAALAGAADGQGPWQGEAKRPRAAIGGALAPTAWDEAEGAPASPGVSAALPVGQVDLSLLLAQQVGPAGRGKPLVRPSPLFQKKADATEAAMNSKGRLNELCSKLQGRPLTKEDLVYTVESGPGGAFRCTVQVAFLGGTRYAGAPCGKRKEAEQSAAAVALSALQAGPQGALVPKKPKTAAKVITVAAGALGGQAAPMKAPPPGQDEMVAMMTEWQTARLEPLDENDVPDSASLDLWYGQVCLACLVVCSKCSWSTHAMGQKHRKRYETAPMKRRADVPRPPTEPCQELMPAPHFKAASGWGQKDESGTMPAVLLVGEMDYSFSLAVAQLRPAWSPLVATSYLEEHDPLEPEVYPADDGERAAYRRRTLPGMQGALGRNLRGLAELGCEVRHGVDAMNLNGTLRSQGIEGGFQYVVFPFPRASLQRACDPRNSRLLRDFFLSVMQEGFMMEGGVVQLVMLGTQYEEWDVACMAADAGLSLVARAQLPENFYQSREMSGKPWTPQGAELLCFSAEAASY